MADEIDVTTVGESSLAGKVAVVAGAARSVGIGAEVVERLTVAGARVVCLDRVAADGDGGTDHSTPERLDAVRDQASRAGDEPGVIDVDATDADALDAALDEVVERHGRIDVCCGLMGTSGERGGSGALIELTTGSWDRCQAINLSAPYYLARGAARRMIAGGRGGAITLLSSYAAMMPSPTAGAIGAARAGLNFLVEALAVELGPHAIRVNAVCPLGVDTSGTPYSNSGLSGLVGATTGASDLADWAQTHIPLGRAQRAGETAAVIAFLSSDAASFVSGQSISVAGGAPG